MSMGGTDNVITRAKIAVDADTSSFDAAMAKIPLKSKLKVKEAMDAIKKEMQEAKLQLQINQGNPTVAKQLTDYLGQLDSRLEKVKKSAIGQAAAMSGVSKAIDAASASVNKGQTNLGMGALMLSQAVEDAQYGFSAIVNNIPGIVMAMGGGPGLAGAASLAAVGINMLSKSFGSFSEMMGTVYIKNISQQLEELGKVANKNSSELAQEKRLTNIQSAIEYEQNTPTEEESTRRQGVRKTVVEGGFGNTKSLVEKIMGDSIRNSLDDNLVGKRDSLKAILEERKKRALDVNMDDRDSSGEEGWLADLTGNSSKAIEAKLELANRAIETAYGAAVAKKIAEFEENPQKVQEFIKHIQANPMQFGGVGKAVKLSNQLEASIKTPEEKEQEARDQEETDKREQRRNENEKLQQAYEKRMTEAQVKANEEIIQRVTQNHAGLKIARSIMNDFVLGVETNRPMLANAIEKLMVASGESAEKAAKLSQIIALNMIDNAQAAIRNRAQRDNVNPQEAARREGRDQAMGVQDAALAERRKQLDALTRGPKLRDEAMILDQQIAGARDQNAMEEFQRRLPIERRRRQQQQNPGQIPAGPDIVRGNRQADAAIANARFQRNMAAKREAAARFRENKRVQRLKGTKKGRAQLDEEKLRRDVLNGVRRDANNGVIFEGPPVPPAQQLAPPAPNVGLNNPNDPNGQMAQEQKDLADAAKKTADNTLIANNTLQDISNAINDLNLTARFGI